MTKIAIEVNSKIIYATLNNTIAAKDFIARLPLTLKMSKSDIDYSCNFPAGEFTIEEMQKGWHNGDIILGGGFFSIMFRAEKDSLGYNVMIIGSIEKEELQKLRNLPNEVQLIFTLE